MLKKIALLLLLIAPMSVFAQKFGHVNTNEIITGMPEFTKMQTELQTMQKQFEDEMKIMQDEYTKKATELQNEAATLPQNIRERRAKELGDMELKIQQFYQDAQQQMQKAQQEKMQPIYQKLQDALKAVGQEGNYVYIFDINSNIPYVSATLSTDVTATVKAKLSLK